MTKLKTAADSLHNDTFELLAQNILNIDHSMQSLTVKAVNRAATLRNYLCDTVE